VTESQIEDGWYQANIARILNDMERYGVTLAELQEAATIPAMVNIARTQTPHQPSGNTVAGE